MAKTKTQFVCQQCGRTAAKSMGRCPQCGEWNSMVAELVPSRKSEKTRSRAVVQSTPVRLRDIQHDPRNRYNVEMQEFSRVLGGGIVPGSLVLIGGDPGIGKSTLLLQIAMALAQKIPTLYISGEESLPQLSTRADRLQGKAPTSDELFLLNETDLDAVLQSIESIDAKVVIVDSIQTVQVADLDSAPGSISQVREAATRFQSVAKTKGVALFLIGHVTKEGAVAGPRVLEHIVDTVLYLEGDAFHAYRLLRSVKNRFGPTTEVGVFEMSSNGLVEVMNPSQAFLEGRALKAPGSSIAVTMEGTRPLLVEIQGLTSESSFGHPRRTANGVDFNRLLLTIAVLNRRVGLSLGTQDVFLNVVGGLRVREPGADLAVAMAIASSLLDQPIPQDVAFIGEIGLSGEIRAVPQLQLRLREAVGLGFSKVLLPGSTKSEKKPPGGIQAIEVASVKQAVEMVFQSGEMVDR